MPTSTATRVEIQSPSQNDDREQLAAALNNWREAVLRWLRDEMSEANEQRQAAEDGLAIAHRNPGQVAEDVISTLWESLERSSDLSFRLARVSDEIQDMELPTLLTLFARTTKLNTYPWEGEQWSLPSSIS